MIIDKYELEENLIKHLEKTSKYAELLAEIICLDREDVEEVRKGALLHDIGKKRVPKNILEKKGKLTDEEFEIIKQHPKQSIKELWEIDMSMIVVNILLYHHEKWNGKGYPFGLQGSEIPLEARIVSVADCYCALRDVRFYKGAFTHEEALKILKDERNESFDSYIVTLFELFQEKFRKL